MVNKTRKGDAMIQTNILEAKTNLSNLVRLVETGAEDRVVIARRGKPVAQICPIDANRKVVFGIAAGKWTAPDDIDFCNDEIAEMFGV